MDTNTLVTEGQTLVRWLDHGKVKPRGAVWVYSSDTDRWRLWIVPSAAVSDKAEFYKLIAETISQHRDEMPTLDVSSIELKSSDHPAVKGLGQFIHMPGLGAATFTNNRFNGYLLPDGVVLRMAI